MPTIYEDTRQKPGRHDNVRAWFEARGWTVKRHKLDKGDYALPPSVSVDTKQGLAEVYQDLVGDHDRFHREYAGAAEDGTRLVFVIEGEDGITCVEDVANWVNPLVKRGIRVRPSASLMRQMQTVAERYGVEWVFCDRAETGRVIEEILTGEKNAAETRIHSP